MPTYTLVPQNSQSQIWVSLDGKMESRVLCHATKPIKVDGDKPLLSIAKHNPSLMIRELGMTCKAMIANGIRLAGAGEEKASEVTSVLPEGTDELFVCEECGDSFASERGLKMHVKMKHKAIDEKSEVS